MTAMVVGREINLSTVSQVLEGCGFTEIRCRTCDSFASCGSRGMDGVDVVVVIKDGMGESSMSGIYEKDRQGRRPRVFLVRAMKIKTAFIVFDFPRRFLRERAGQALLKI